MGEDKGSINREVSHLDGSLSPNAKSQDELLNSFGNASVIIAADDNLSYFLDLWQSKRLLSLTRKAYLTQPESIDNNNCVYMLLSFRIC